jgi:uncharacterized protein YacL
MFRRLDQFIKRPTKKQLILFTIFWLIIALILILVMTDLFTKSPFQRKYFGVFLILIFSFMPVLNLWLQYKKNSGGK